MASTAIGTFAQLADQAAAASTRAAARIDALNKAAFGALVGNSKALALQASLGIGVVQTHLQDGDATIVLPSQKALQHYIRATADGATPAQALNLAA